MIVQLINESFITNEKFCKGISMEVESRKTILRNKAYSSLDLRPHGT